MRIIERGFENNQQHPGGYKTGCLCKAFGCRYD